jgi:glycerol-3-phosphate dehydrogenase (NAD(P)+)
MSEKIAVIGAGGWGIALAKLLAEQQHQITLWCHGAQNYQELAQTRQSTAYLPGISLPRSVAISRSLADTVAAARLILCVAPSHTVRQVMAQAAPHCRPGAAVVCGTKGLEEENLQTMGEVLRDVFDASHSLAFLSGPTFALEIARGLPAAATIASRDDMLARRVQETLRTASFRIYTSRDIIGVQMGGVIKNVIAIAAGISDGLGLGGNARAALITRGLAEMTRLAVRMGADPLTLAGLPGLGDLVLTCSGDLSRNRAVGLAIGRGQKLTDIVAGMKTVAEGIRNTRSVYLLSRRVDIEMPIVEQMFQVLYQQKKPPEAVRDLLLRTPKAENS